MIVKLCFVKRRADLTFEEFRDYWTGPYVDNFRKSVWGQPNPHIIRYSQHLLSPTTRNGVPTEPLYYDGFSEMWYASQEAADEIEASEYFRTTPKEHVFDVASVLWVADDERVVVDRSGSGSA